MKALLRNLRRGLFLLIPGLLLLALMGCNRDKRESPQTQPTQQAKREVSGEVFIVLKSHETLKFSLVQVALIDAAVAAAQFDTLRTQTNVYISGLTNLVQADSGLRPITESWSDLIPAVSLTLGKAQTEYDSAKSLFWAAYNVQMENAPNRRGIGRDDPRWSVAQAKADEAAKIVAKSGKAMDALRARLERLEPADQAFQRLLRQALVSEATTDSDGKFQMTVPVSGKFYLWATVTREVGDKNELYVWLVPLTNEMAQKVMLSNNNAR